MGRPSRFAPEVRERAIRMVLEHQGDHESQWAAIDLLCLLPSWPKSRVIDLAPANWQQTLEQQDTQQRLDANPFRTAILALERDHPDDE